ncbi:glycosyltransferase family 2 protein [Leucobacter sp. UT-8R-CII-1-4]|uniref:glycosyltransferase family 2 protein n=1 Tax=Leucobacter sp. UT-8R-CII-1-4 TaxID=3040075 RepID=UPI0024A89CF3|nr:glycosyltransferase family 2 protein [Leucobacter sp. UT-8R-CII-1-4]MDI6023747.1 glycosyltransferase family 2 protein [Leucobacter sp. UT-8R-CII-1-4]
MTELPVDPATSVAPSAAFAHSNSDTWVIIPLYNEATVVGEVVTGLLPTFPNVVCIDDGSQDGSGEIVRKAGARLVSHPINLGQGAALQTGFDYAIERNAKYVVTFDADGQHRVQDALAMVERARDENLAIVFGSRFLDNRTKPGLIKKIVLKTAVMVTNWTTRTRLTDAHNGLRVIREDAVRKIHLKQDRMAHGTEIIAQLGRTGLPYAEQPVEVLYTEYSKAKGQSLLNSVNILIDLIIR